MPHLILEFSANIIEKNNITELFQQCHTILADMLPTDIAGCKSRAVECNTNTIGNGDLENAFVHMTLKVMPGRTIDILNDVGNRLMEIMTDYFSGSLKELHLQITLEICHLETYFKVNS